MNNSPELSVIIASYNGRKKLENILPLIERQTFSNFEVIIILDGSTDGSNNFLSNYKSNNLNISVIERPNGGRSVARNHGAKLANGSLLVFLDDDMLPFDNVLEKHYKFHKRHSRSIYGGNQIENIAAAKHDFDMYRSFLRKKWNVGMKGLKKLDESNLRLTAANFSMRKSDFYDVGGFDERLTDAEDIMLAVKVLNRGYRVYFDSDCIAYHDDFVSVRKYISRRVEYFKSVERLKKLGYKNKWIEKKEIKFSYFKSLIYHLFKGNFFVNLIEKERLLFLPREYRYFLYDLILQSASVHQAKKLK